MPARKKPVFVSCEALVAAFATLGIDVGDACLITISRDQIALKTYVLDSKGKRTIVGNALATEDTIISLTK